MNKRIDLAAISLGEHGNVVLSDSELETMISDENVTTAGSDGETNVNQCYNRSSCEGSTNVNYCSNHRSCDGSTNPGNCLPNEN
ncbi:MAG: hypothetical protein R3C31_12335 [Hyphomonadaceae bacterium]